MLSVPSLHEEVTYVKHMHRCVGSEGWSFVRGCVLGLQRIDYGFHDMSGFKGVSIERWHCLEVCWVCLQFNHVHLREGVEYTL